MGKKLLVTNKGKTTRYRLGVGFEPNKPKEIEVSKTQVITVKAVRDFEVEFIEEAPKKENVSEEPKEEAEETEDEDFKEELQESNIDDFIDTVIENHIDIDRAIAIETEGKNRVTLIERLEEFKEAKEEK